jgi:hypothetical protein
VIVERFDPDRLIWSDVLLMNAQVERCIVGDRLNQPSQLHWCADNQTAITRIGFSESTNPFITDLP